VIFSSWDMNGVLSSFPAGWCLQVIVLIVQPHRQQYLRQQRHEHQERAERLSSRVPNCTWSYPHKRLISLMEPTNRRFN
jgi:hypothetical protein